MLPFTLVATVSAPRGVSNTKNSNNKTTKNSEMSFDYKGNGFTAAMNIAQNGKFINVKIPNIGGVIKASLSELGMFDNGFVAIAAVTTGMSIVDNNERYKNKKVEAIAMNAVDVGSLAASLAVGGSIVEAGGLAIGTVFISGIAALVVITGVAIGGATYGVKKGVD